jgi:tetratricopeptide (TPR) repeat protein
MWALPFALFCTAVAASSGAAGAPSVWQRAEAASRGEDPVALARSYREALRLEMMATLLGSSRGDVAVEELRLRGVSSLLAGGAARSEDPAVLRLLGAMYASLRRCEQAEIVLRRSIALAPRDPQSASAWFDVAICASVRGDRAAEAAGYERALAIADDPRERAVLESNLAEAKMGLGDLGAGIAAAERSIAIRDDVPAAHWNLAILHDRADDGAAALRAARDATALDPDFRFLDGPGVFFEPAYERRWYHALGELALAERAKASALERRAHLEAARQEYEGWLAAASPDDRWRAIAQGRVIGVGKMIAAMAPPSTTKP